MPLQKQQPHPYKSRAYKQTRRPKRQLTPPSRPLRALYSVPSLPSPPAKPEQEAESRRARPTRSFPVRGWAKSQSKSIVAPS
ncbi:hypothetical protein BJY01DRAFT_211940 [Aspergillus pseudoustus]|uniref:Uncharacterized protein n=1 Tax=Aspergillus pseudoustus TaxID=1810923 RepID=A0ABR4K7W7_9EURO